MINSPNRASTEGQGRVNRRSKLSRLPTGSRKIAKVHELSFSNIYKFVYQNILRTLNFLKSHANVLTLRISVDPLPLLKLL